MLIAFTPAGKMEELFRELYKRGGAYSNDPQFFRAYGLELLGPHYPWNEKAGAARLLAGDGQAGSNSICPRVKVWDLRQRFQTPRMSAYNGFFRPSASQSRRVSATQPHIC
jgi:hypothetical protein